MTRLCLFCCVAVFMSAGCQVSPPDGTFTCESDDGCPPGFTCGFPEMLCFENCRALLCTDLTCGVTSDGCGGSLDCGGCDDGLVCNEGNTCVRPCEPRVDCPENTCASIPDRCGGSLDCTAPCASGVACLPNGFCRTCERSDPDDLPDDPDLVMTQRLERLRGNLTTVLTPGDRDLVYFGFPAPIDGVVNIEIDSGNDNVEVEVLPVCAAGQPRYTRCDSSSGEAFINAGAACVARNLAALEVECRREDEARPPMVALAIALNADSNVCEEIDVSYSIVEASSL